jgi:dTDP-4-amino-4,6-dideoxygalactose transaminase
MRQLAVEGGRPLISTPIKKLNTVTKEQVEAVHAFMETTRNGLTTLSGYLAGSYSGGPAVQRLEDMWRERFSVRHAIAVNSGTSALLAAVHVATHGSNDPTFTVGVPALGMSAAAAVPHFLGHNIEFVDVDEFFCIDPNKVRYDIDIVMAVNLFGHPAQLQSLRTKAKNVWLIEDNAQAPFARESGKYTGTIGDIGCSSMNVHKPINAGEGGMITTNDDTVNNNIRQFINHGEVNDEASTIDVGLNLRMTELTAVIVLAQMDTAGGVVVRRSEIATALYAGAYEQNGLLLPGIRKNCLHARYCFPMLATDKLARNWAVRALNAEGVPCRDGYMLMPKLGPFQHYPGEYPKAQDYESRMILIELTAIDPSQEQVEQMSTAIDDVGRRLAG